MFALKAETVFTPLKMLKDVYILLEEGKIVKLAKTVPENVASVHSYENCIVAPGFTDIHMHGGFGFDIMCSSENDIRRLAEKLPETGVTSFIPSTVADSLETLRAVSEKVYSARKARGSEIVGIHFEGPCLNVKMAGAQAREHIRPLSIDEVKALTSFSSDFRKRFTVAPEVEGGIEFIKGLRGLNVIVSIGHSDASYTQAVQAFSAGATIVTHIFNCMRVFHHRDPGLVGAALSSPKVYVEAILDLVHLHPATVHIVYKCKGPKKVVLVTDSMAGAGLPDGTYRLGCQEVVVKDGAPRLSDGSLAGSTLTMVKAVKNAVGVGIPFSRALEMASATPCRAMMLDRKGLIEAGFDADLVVLDKKFNVVATYIKGERLF